MKVLVGKDSEIMEGRLKSVMADGRTFVVGRYEGQLFAMDGRCSHAGFDLAYGTVRNGSLVCPAHGATFDVKSGKKMALAGARDLRVYLVSVEGDDVFVEI